MSPALLTPSVVVDVPASFFFVWSCPLRKNAHTRATRLLAPGLRFCWCYQPPAGRLRRSVDSHPELLPELCPSGPPPPSLLSRPLAVPPRAIRLMPHQQYKALTQPPYKKKKNTGEQLCREHHRLPHPPVCPPSQVALEWLLAKVGRRLAETPAEDGLGSFLGIEDRPCSASPLPDILGEDGSGVGEAGTDGGGGGGDGAAPPVGDDEGVGAWGGELSVVPAALCDAALRENVRWELEARQGGGAVVAIEDLTGDPTERLPWESVGVEGQRPGARPAEQEQGSSRTNVGRGMVFGDAGKWGAEQSTMFQITDGGGGAAGSEGESEADGGTEGRGEEGAGWSAVDVVQVRAEADQGGCCCWNSSF